MVTLDAYCNRLRINPDFVKVDVEGHELAVLAGSENLLSVSSPPALMVEVQADHRPIVVFCDARVTSFLLQMEN